MDTKAAHQKIGFCLNDFFKGYDQQQAVPCLRNGFFIDYREVSPAKKIRLPKNIVSQELIKRADNQSIREIYAQVYG